MAFRKFARSHVGTVTKINMDVVRVSSRGEVGGVTLIKIMGVVTEF